MIFIEIFLQAIEDIVFIPLVISKNPVKSPWIKLVSMFKTLNIGDIIVVRLAKIPLAFKIEIMLEKITTNPTNQKNGRNTICNTLS